MEHKQGQLFNRINQELKAALKAKDELRLATLRMIKSKILYVNARGELPEVEIIKIIKKYAKELKEALGEFQKAQRQEAANQLQKELAIVQEFLPPSLSEAALKKLVEETIKETAATSLKDMGKVMKAILSKAPAADGKIVNQLVREVLAK